MPRILAEHLACIPRDYARRHQVAAVSLPDGRRVLLCPPAAPDCVLHNVKVLLGLDLPRHEAPAETVVALLDAAGETLAPRIEELPTISDPGLDLDAAIRAAEQDLLSTDGRAPMVNLVNRLLLDAVRARASDLHIQPLAEAVVLRHRVDGVLEPGQRIPLVLLRPLVSRIKVMGRMDVAERLVPQDGRTTVRLGQRAIDVRISTIPTPHGERVVLRLLDSAKALHDFPRLGMPERISRAFLAAARKTSGIILVTGPTGSGKTTTLYATLCELEARERNIMTIEDPIEYELDTLGLPISQSQVNLRKGLSFATGLRHILRQDPDIILVGEIRDAETARIAIQSSLTGHLVFSTLHTNDALSAVTRLVDLGVEPYLVAASLSAVLAQRLVRTCCQACRGAGCPACAHSGFQGRTGIFELLAFDDELRRLVGEGATLDRIRQHARASGLKTLQDHGRELVAAGLSTATEVERVTHA